LPAAAGSPNTAAKSSGVSATTGLSLRIEKLLQRLAWQFHAEKRGLRV
jgi:hypothetical protein